MRKVLIGFLAMGLCVLGLGAMWMVRADDDDSLVKFTAKLDGFQELGGLSGPTGAILSEGKGTLTLILNKKTQQFTFELNYTGLSTPVTQSHIHFGRVHTAGGIMVFFCTNVTTPQPAGIPVCPATGGEVTGVRSAGDVKAIAGQNVSASDFDALTDALFSNTAYANIHTTKFPAGEIRGQIRLEGRGQDRDRDRK
jgi:hypothetical protein